MDRRTLMTGMLGTAAAASLWTAPSAFALGLPKDKIKRVRYYKTPTDAAGRPNIHQPTFNQSTNIVTIETEGGLIGIGEGGEPSTMEQCAGLLIGQDPFRIEHLWQRMYRGYFYPAGREKTHSLGGLDLANQLFGGGAAGLVVTKSIEEELGDGGEGEFGFTLQFWRGVAGRRRLFLSQILRTD